MGSTAAPKTSAVFEPGRGLTLQRVPALLGPCPQKGSSGLASSCCTGLLQVHARRRKLDPDVDLLQIAKDLPGLSGELLQPLPALHLSGRASAEPAALQPAS